MSPPHDVVINTDGGARGNPGPAALGVVICAPDGTVLAEIAEALGVQTNNVAEYTAVVRGLQKADEIGARVARVRSDSLLVVEQLNGRWKIKKPTLQVLHQTVRALAKKFDEVTYEHVRREYNAEADALVNHALDQWVFEHGYPTPDPGSAQGSLLEDD
ncbi:MAG: ribonuclease HI family protein [Actinomycetota bacterium]|nr:ribonuclease HI family protein [Actinomycetota bacterium]